jgi:hypothetical protein
MIPSIHLISPEDAQKPFWAQYHQLWDALKQTKRVLASLGVKDFPDETGGNPSDVSAPARSASHVSKKGPLTQSEALRQACQSIPGDFNKAGAIQWIVDHHPDLTFNPISIGAMLSAWAKERKGITVVHPGVGGGQAVYRRIDPESKDVQDLIEATIAEFR